MNVRGIHVPFLQELNKGESNLAHLKFYPINVNNISFKMLIADGRDLCW